MTITTSADSFLIRRLQPRLLLIMQRIFHKYYLTLPLLLASNSILLNFGHEQRNIEGLTLITVTGTATSTHCLTDPLELSVPHHICMRFILGAESKLTSVATKPLLFFCKSNLNQTVHEDYSFGEEINVSDPLYKTLIFAVFQSDESLNGSRNCPHARGTIK
jgi:hypothetical protein